MRTYTYGNYIDEPITMTASGSGPSPTYYYHTNNLYNVRALTDSNGDVVERYRYTAYGEPTILDDQGNERQRSAVGNPYMFQGRRRDTETDLYYYRNRYYSATLGRFISRDPIKLVNEYTGFADRPTISVDPYGLQEAESGILKFIEKYFVRAKESPARWDWCRKFRRVAYTGYNPKCKGNLPCSQNVTNLLRIYRNMAGRIAFGLICHGSFGRSNHWEHITNQENQIKDCIRKIKMTCGGEPPSPDPEPQCESDKRPKVAPRIDQLIRDRLRLRRRLSGRAAVRAGMCAAAGKILSKMGQIGGQLGRIGSKLGGAVLIVPTTLMGPDVLPPDRRRRRRDRMIQ